MFLFRIIDALKDHKVPYAVAGGFAVALHGAIRGTIDVDLVIRLRKKDFAAVEAALKSIGLVPRLPVTAEQVFDFRDEYIRNRNLIAWSFHNPQNPMEIVDVILTHDLSKLSTVTIPHQGRKIRVLSLDSLISMKEGTGRDQDGQDVKALRRLKEKS